MFLPLWLEHAFRKNGISLTSRFQPKPKTLDLSHLCYAVKKHAQYQVIVKLLGSFRLTALNRHLHRYCIFTELVPETVLQSLHHSCASELHVYFVKPQNILWTKPTITSGVDYIFISTLFAFSLLYIFFFRLDSFETQDS